MKLHLHDQFPAFARHLEHLRRLPVMPYERHRLTEKVSSVSIHHSGHLQELDLAVLFRYRIFPPAILTALGAWEATGRSMQVGDTVVQQVFLPPFRHLSLKLIMGVRINAIIRETDRVGFSYETLQGHVERGLSTFTLEKGADGQTAFRIHTFSEPAAVPMRLLGPVVARPYQAFCTQQALQHVRRTLETALHSDNLS